MNFAYLDSLPEVENVYGFRLEPGEKAVFATTINALGNSKGLRMSSGMTPPPFTLTNRRILVKSDVVNNNIWSFDLNNIKEFYRFDKKALKIFKTHHYKAVFIRPLSYMGRKNPYDNSSFANPIVEHELPEIQLYFSKEDEPKIDEILRGLNS